MSFLFSGLLHAEVKKTTKDIPQSKGNALTPAQRKQLQTWQNFLNDKKVTENSWPKEMCGQDFPIVMDASLAPAFMEAKNEASLYCREVRDKLSTMCRNSKDLGNNNKAKITKLIKKINCTLAAGEDEASFKIMNGELQASLGAKASNISEKLLEFLDATPE